MAKSAASVLAAGLITREVESMKTKLYALNMKVTLETRQRIEAEAKESGRSLAQTVERRIERSYRDDDVVELLERARGGKANQWRPGVVYDLPMPKYEFQRSWIGGSACSPTVTIIDDDD